MSHRRVTLLEPPDPNKKSKFSPKFAEESSKQICPQFASKQIKNAKLANVSPAKPNNFIRPCTLRKPSEIGSALIKRRSPQKSGQLDSEIAKASHTTNTARQGKKTVGFKKTPTTEAETVNVSSSGYGIDLTSSSKDRGRPRRSTSFTERNRRTGNRPRYPIQTELPNVIVHQPSQNGFIDDNSLGFHECHDNYRQIHNKKFMKCTSKICDCALSNDCVLGKDLFEFKRNPKSRMMADNDMLGTGGPGKVVQEAATSSLEEDSSPRLKIHPRTSSFTISSSSMWSNGTEPNFSLSPHRSYFVSRNKPLYGLEYKQDKVVVKTLTRDERRKNESDSEIFSDSSSLSSVEKEPPGAYRRKRMVEQRQKLIDERESMDDSENNSNDSFPSTEDSDANEGTFLLSLPLTISRSVSSQDLTARSSSKSKTPTGRRHGVSSGRIREAQRLEESVKSQFRKIQDLLDEDVSSDSFNEEDAKGGSNLIDYAEYGLYIPPASDTDPDEPYIEVEKK